MTDYDQYQIATYANALMHIIARNTPNMDPNDINVKIDFITNGVTITFC